MTGQQTKGGYPNGILHANPFKFQLFSSFDFEKRFRISKLHLVSTVPTTAERKINDEILVSLVNIAISI
jgi:hypothetical protein